MPSWIGENEKWLENIRTFAIVIYPQKATLHLQLNEKHGVEVAVRGTPFGVSESYVTVYKTDMYLDGLMAMILETGRNKYVSSARTVPVTPLIFPQ